MTDIVEQNSNLNPSVQPSVDNTVFIPALIVILTLSAFLIFLPDISGPIANTAKIFVTDTFSWLFLIITASALVFALWLALGPYGHVKLGSKDEEPEYSTLHWVAMMFTCGVGAGLIVWGFVEPIFYLATPPLGLEVGSNKAIEFAHMYPLFHWGVSSWAIYVVPAVPIAYLLYVRKKPVLRVSTACEGVLPKRGRKHTKTVIDILIIFGIIGGNATALGLGVPMVSALLAEFLGIPETQWIKFGMLLLWTALFSFSVYRGLKRGIKILADVNMVLALIAIAFIFIAGPTLFITKMAVNSIGLMTANFPVISLWTDPIGNSHFPEDWTVFYWTWYVAFTAFVGLFIARISRGRTIRQMIIGVLFWGTMGTSLFLMVVGGYALHLEQSGALPVSEILKDSNMFVLTAKILASLPMGKFVLLIFIILSIIFYATNVDSAAYILASICSKDLQSHQEPPRSNRLVWALLLAMITAGLLQANSITTVQAATIICALPLIPIILMMCVSLIKWLREDFKDINKDKILTLD